MKAENKETQFLFIKPDKPKEQQVRWTVETDIFYLAECKHCMIVFLVEESIDSHIDPEHPEEISLKCPVCHTNNLIPKRENRLKLKLDRIMKPEEENPWYDEIIERSKRRKEVKIK